MSTYTTAPLSDMPERASVSPKAMAGRGDASALPPLPHSLSHFMLLNHDITLKRLLVMILCAVQSSY